MTLWRYNWKNMDKDIKRILRTKKVLTKSKLREDIESGAGGSRARLCRFHRAQRMKEPSRGWDLARAQRSGAGGSRTLVRTRKPYAFYTLILAFIFELQQDPSHQLQPYLLKLHPCIGAYSDYFRFNLRRLISGFGTTSSERRLVPLPCKGIKPVIYYTSIRQREHTHCCQL